VSHTHAWELYKYRGIRRRPHKIPRVALCVPEQRTLPIEFRSTTSPGNSERCLNFRMVKKENTMTPF
ncbi:MAG: hypothetical protein ACKO96_25510, partial [Flammeovirgaceae bacterium]